MATPKDSHWLYLSIGVGILIAARFLSSNLIETVTLNEIHHTLALAPSSPSASDPSIETSTLSNLTDSSNPNIRKSATSLLLNRLATTRPAINDWTTDLFSASRATRTRAWHLIVLFLEHEDGLFASTPRPPVLRLISLLDKTRNRNTPGARTLRAACLAAHTRLERGDSVVWDLLARMSARLEHYMVSCPVLVAERLGEGDRVMYWAMAQERLLDCADPERDKVYRSAVRRLLRDAQEEGDGEAGVEVDQEDSPDVIGTYDGQVPSWLRVAGTGRQGRSPRFSEESPEEIEMRRRRREAIVLHEGVGEISRDDIIHPRRTSP